MPNLIEILLADIEINSAKDAWNRLSETAENDLDRPKRILRFGRVQRPWASNDLIGRSVYVRVHV